VLSVVHVPRVMGFSRQRANGTFIALPGALNMASSSPPRPLSYSKSTHSLGHKPAYWICCLPNKECWGLYVTDKAFLKEACGEALYGRGAASHIVAVSKEAHPTRYDTQRLRRGTTALIFPYQSPNTNSTPFPIHGCRLGNPIPVPVL
jgi:hypothetical protein